MSVSLVLLAAVVLSTLAGWGAFWRVRNRRRVPGADLPSTDDLTGLIGLEGDALETFSGKGSVRVAGEVWRANLPRGIVERGERVRVVGYATGLVLLVERLEVAQKGR